MTSNFATTAAIAQLEISLLSATEPVDVWECIRVYLKHSLHVDGVWRTGEGVLRFERRGVIVELSDDAIITYDGITITRKETRRGCDEICKWKLTPEGGANFSSSADKNMFATVDADSETGTILWHLRETLRSGDFVRMK